MHVAPEQDDGPSADRAKRKCDPPAKGSHRRFAEDRLEQKDRHGRQKLSADESHVLERREEAAPAGARHFAEVGGRRTVLATGREALDHASQQQQQWRDRAGLSIGRRQGDEERSRAHHQH